MKRKRRTLPVTTHNGNTIRHLPTGAFMADFNHKGARKRKCFDTLNEAKTAIDQWKIAAKNTGVAAFSLVEADRVDVTAARKWLGKQIRLAEVFRFWRVHHPDGEARSIEALVDEFLDAPGRRGGRSVERREATTEGHRKRLLPLLEAFPDRLASEVTTPEVERWLDSRGWTGLNRRHYLAAVKALFAFAIRKGYATMNPAGEIELPEVRSADPIIMTPTDVEKYLGAVAATCPELLPREVIGFFCGLRPEELTRLDWRNVSLENRLVTVGADVAKIQGHRRNVEIPANLLVWLAPHARHEGPVWPYASPTTLHTKRTGARKAAAVEVPGNAGRHAFASYHLALHQNGAMTSEALGHANVKLLKSVYRNIVASDGRPITKATAERFFAICPRQGALEFRTHGQEKQEAFQ